MKKNQTRYAILGLLAHEALSGYDIKKRIENSLSLFWTAGFGQIYPALKDLEKQGLVTKEIQMNQDKPNRKEYSITEAGLEELRKWLVVPVEKENIKYELLLKLFFGSQIPVENNIANIAEFETRSAANFEMLSRFEAQLRPLSDENVDHVYYLLTVLFGKYVYDAYLKWASEATDMLRSLNKS